MPTYIQKITAADVSLAGGTATRVLSSGTGTDTSWGVVLGGNSSETHFFVTNSGVPNSSAWESGGTQTFELQIDNQNMLLQGSCRVGRCADDGTILQVGSFTGEQGLDQTSRTFSPVAPTWTLGEEDAENRYFIELLIRNTSGMGGTDGDFGVGTTSNEVITDITEDNNPVDADGTPQAATATASGTGVVSVDADGSPQAATALGDGTGVVSVDADGSPQADTAIGDGTGIVSIDADGSPQAEAATGSGTAEVSIAADGSPQAETAIGSGTVEVSIAADGSPQAETATASGSAVVVDSLGSGTPQAETALGAGSATVSSDADGSPQAETALGSGAAEVSIAADGSPQADTALGSGSAEISVASDGSPQAQTALGAGTGVVSVDADGFPQADTAVGSGAAVVSAGASGSPQAETALGSGSAIISVVASGIPQADVAQASGNAVVSVSASGSPQAQTALGSGSGTVTGALDMSVIDTLQAILQASISGDGGASAAQLALLAAYSIPEAKYARSSEVMLQAAYAGGPIIGSSAAALLVAYRTGPVENLQARAWEFTLDGHTFYVLTLGEQGTFVYDLTTEQWAQWITGGLNTWNMEIGTTWKGKVVAGDQAEPTIWEMTPNIFLDDGFKAITRVATGGLSIRQREVASNYAFRITASMGEPVLPITAPVTNPTITLAISDDQGETFQDMGSLMLIEDDFKQTLQWLSLGQIEAPMRIFKITDVGAIARIDGADAEVETDEDEGSA